MYRWQVPLAIAFLTYMRHIPELRAPLPLPARHSEAAVTDAATPTLQRLMLGEELRHIRESRGMTIEQVSQGLSERLGPGFSTAKISRLETAKRGITQRVWQHG